MDNRVFFLTMGLAVTLAVPKATAGQQEAQQAATAGAQVTQVAQCRGAQAGVTAGIEAALKRLDVARQTNSAAVMRGAADDLQAALLDVRTQLAPCAQMQAAASDAPAGHTMPSGQQAPAAAPGAPAMPAMLPGASSPVPAVVAPRAPAPGSSSPARPASPGVADPHGGHAMPPAASTNRAASAGKAQPAPAPASASRGAAAADPHATMAMPATPTAGVADLKCRNQVDPKTAPRVLHQGRMYYFCTESDRAEFAKDPGKHVKQPAQAAPAQAR